jgi:hypothetical protein
MRTANKRLHVNQRVSGAVGEYMEGPTKHYHWQKLYGHIISVEEIHGENR